MRSLVRLLAIAFVLALVGGGCSLAPASCTPASGCTAVLFVGNSYTYVNDLPATFAKLAASGGRRVETGMVAEGGQTLAGQVTSSDLAQRLASRPWNVVVLQEQSEIPAATELRRSVMEPAASQLVARAESIGARPVLFMTWGHRDGWPEHGIPTYDAMQAAIDATYTTVGSDLGVSVAPVGRAWAAARRQAPPIALWADDGSHPTPAGTYLAAAVFYAEILGASPTAATETDGLSDADARTLRELATEAVFGAPS